MILTKHDCYRYLFELKKNGKQVDSLLTEIMATGKITKEMVTVISENYTVPIKCFYERLNNKSHKIIKEILTCDGDKTAGSFVKMATSLMTQAIITLEHDFQKDPAGADKFIKCLQLSELSTSLAEYFNHGNYVPLVRTIKSLQEDIKLILD